MDKVLRTFTDGIGRVSIGQIVDGSRFRNLGFLRRRGFLIPVEDDAAPTPREVKAVVEPEETIADAPAEIEIVEESETQTDETPATLPVNNADIIDQIANEAVTVPAEAAKPTPPKKKKH